MRLETHNLPDLRPVAGDDVLPGELVRDKDDLGSLGICIGRHWGPSNKPMQCEVLWSVVPWSLEIKVTAQNVTAKSRQLGVTWNPQSLSEPGMLKW